MALTLDTFEEITLRVLAEHGLSNYAPTLALVATQDIRVLTGVPEDEEDTTAMLDWFVQQEVGAQIFLFGVRSGEDEVTVGHCGDGDCEFRLIVEREGTFEVTPLGVPVWWRFGPSEPSRH